MKIENMRQSVLGQYPKEGYAEAFDAIFNLADGQEIKMKEIREALEVETHELAEGLTSPYTADALDFYKENLERIYYLEEAIGMGAKTGIDILVWGVVEYWTEKIEEVKELITEWLKTHRDNVK